MTWEYLATIPIVLGTLAQRITGLGFALLAAPVFVLFFGPDAGVLLVNLCGIAASGVGVAIDWRRIEWGRLALLTPAAVGGVLSGTVIGTVLARPLLEITVGVVLLAGLASLIIRRRPSRAASRRGTFAAGGTAGLAGALAGLPGPPIALYAGATGWKGPSMSATLQVLFFTTSTTAFAVKIVSGVATLPSLDIGLWVAIVIALTMGLSIGHVLGPRIPPTWPWRILLVIAVAGALATIAHGFLSL
ncbi:MAG: hypothetical protein EAS51_06025 [Microbacteriaceae bacterium]|nr:MAG: hypothetical protein EAS51_06025 [Microbacteriaceae bacterium]